MEKRCGALTTIYIDVYFLINFTVDLLAFHLAAVFTKVRVKGSRLLFASLTSAIYACAMIFISDKALISALVSIASLVIASYILVGGIRLIRRIKLMISFFLFLTVIGGIVYLAYCFIDKYFPNQGPTEVHDRRLLVLSMLILLSIGIIRLLFVLFFNSATERAASLKIELLGSSVAVDALVDSGNLLKDPIDMTPVMLVKENAITSLFPCGIPSIEGPELDQKVKRLVRLIPVNEGGRSVIKLGLRPERVFIRKKNRYVETKLTFIIDREKGTFGGYDALIPACAMENI